MAVSTQSGKATSTPTRKVQVGSMVGAATTLVMFGLTMAIGPSVFATNPDVLLAASTLISGAVSTVFGFGAAYLTKPDPSEAVRLEPADKKEAAEILATKGEK